MSDEIPPLLADVTVPIPPDRAFTAFTAGFDDWWPPAFTWSQPANLVQMRFGTAEGDLLNEIGPHGFRLDWGRITRWDPPEAVGFTWQIGPDRVPVPDPDRASLVEVTFRPSDRGTQVAVRHHRWAAHGDGAAAYREQFAPAWPMALEAYAATSTR